MTSGQFSSDTLIENSDSRDRNSDMEYSVIKLRYRIVDFIGFYVLFSVINGSNGLECFACNYTDSTLTNNACPASAVRKCAGNSVCIAAAYEMTPISIIGNKAYTVVWDCFPNMANQECDHFIKGQRHLQPPVSIESKSCYTCTTDLCNKDRLQPSNYGISNLNAGLTTVIITVISPYILKLLVA